MSIDVLARHVAIKVVAVRELAKFAPAHPLVLQAVREAIGNKAIMKFNGTGRSMDHELNRYAPTEEKSQAIFRTARK